MKGMTHYDPQRLDVEPYQTCHIFSRDVPYLFDHGVFLQLSYTLHNCTLNDTINDDSHGLKHTIDSCWVANIAQVWIVAKHNSISVGFLLLLGVAFTESITQMLAGEQQTSEIPKVHVTCFHQIIPVILKPLHIDLT